MKHSAGSWFTLMSNDHVRGSPLARASLLMCGAHTAFVHVKELSSLTMGIHTPVSEPVLLAVGMNWFKCKGWRGPVWTLRARQSIMSYLHPCDCLGLDMNLSYMPLTSNKLSLASTCAFFLPHVSISQWSHAALTIKYDNHSSGKGNVSRKVAQHHPLLNSCTWLALTLEGRTSPRWINLFLLDASTSLFPDSGLPIPAHVRTKYFIWHELCSYKTCFKTIFS